MTMEWYGEEMVARQNVYTREALKQAAEMVLAKAVAVCPVDKGALIRSATVNETNAGKTQELSFNTEYALLVHEMPSSNNFSKAGTGPKYLETPLRENADKVLKLLNDATARGLRR